MTVTTYKHQDTIKIHKNNESCVRVEFTTNIPTPGTYGEYKQSMLIQDLLCNPKTLNEDIVQPSIRNRLLPPSGHQVIINLARYK